MATRRGPDGSARISVSGQMGGVAWANVFWFMLAGGTTAGQAGFDTVVSGVGEQYFTILSAGLSPGVSITQSKGTLFQPNNQALQSVHTMAHAGTATGTQVKDLAASVVFSWTTNVYWRGGKPRTYLPGVMEGDVDGSLHALSPAAITAWRTKATNLLGAFNALNGAGITQVTTGFVSFFSGKAPRPTPLFYAYSAAQVHARLGTQRRRLGPWVP